MCSIALEIPNDMMAETQLTANDATNMARRMLALGLYTQCGVSLARCAEMAGMAEEDFILFLGNYHISIFQFEDEDELLKDMMIV